MVSTSVLTSVLIFEWQIVMSFPQARLMFVQMFEMDCMRTLLHRGWYETKTSQNPWRWPDSRVCALIVSVQWKSPCHHKTLVAATESCCQWKWTSARRLSTPFCTKRRTCVVSDMPPVVFIHQDKVVTAPDVSAALWRHKWVTETQFCWSFISNSGLLFIAAWVATPELWFLHCCKRSLQDKHALFVYWLLNVPATCYCILGTDLLRQLYMYAATMRNKLQMKITVSLFFSFFLHSPAISLGFTILSEIFCVCDRFCNPTIDSDWGSHIPSSWVVHAGCVFVVSIHLSRKWMSGSFESVRWNTCVHRLDLRLYSHPRVLGKRSRNPYQLQGKIPSTGKILPRGGSNPRHCNKQDSEPSTLPSYSSPLSH